MDIQIRAGDCAIGSFPKALEQIVQLAETILDDGAASCEDLQGIIAQIHAVALQPLANGNPLVGSEWLFRTNCEDVHKASCILARRAIAIRSDYLEMIQAGWRVETSRKKLSNGNYSIYARYRRGSGKHRQSKYIGLVYSGRDG